MKYYEKLHNIHNTFSNKHFRVKKTESEFQFTSISQLIKTETQVHALTALYHIQYYSH
jgi:hypothetical protein